MIEMSVGQHHGINALWVDRQRGPIAQAQLFEPLKQAAIDQDAMSICFDQVL